MIRTQRWTPDTCVNPASQDSCVFLEEWDDTIDAIARTHNFKQRERVCSRHAILPDGAACFLANYDENRRKNTTWSIALSIKASLLLEQFKWSFNLSGVLLVDLTSFATTQQKTQLQNFCDVQFGLQKVIVS